MHKKIYRRYMYDSLYSNSIYLMLSNGIMAFFGFFFWIINARLYKPEQVGIATTLISVMALISSFSLLGFNVALVRYLPKSSSRSEKINSALILIISATVIVSVIFIGGLKIFSPKLIFLQSNFFYILTFTLFVIGSSLSTIAESIFLAFRASYNTLIKNAVLSIQKIVFPIFFVFLGAYGIFSSVALATFISALVSYAILITKYHYQPSIVIKKKAIKEMAMFSGGNYIATFFSQAPTLILPLLIINVLNAKIAAYYYIGTMILGFLTIIPTAATQSLLAEGSYDSKELKKHYLKAIRITFVLLLPTVLLFVLFGNIILHFFGKNYADESFGFLRIISFSALFMSISSLGSSILRIHHQIRELIIVNLLSAVLVLGFTYLFISHGLTGIGFGWFVGQALSAVVYMVFFGKEMIITDVRRLIQNKLAKSPAV